MKLFVDFNTITGKIKPFNAINNAPISSTSNELFYLLQEANVPYSRLHDTGGRYGQFVFVDIENIFRNFEADAELPESYDFAFTDWLIGELVKNKVEPFFRLGASIENSHRLKAYRIFPPKDNLKWAKICEGIIKHYNHGWANGYEYGIKYWEIWNEPDNEPVIADNPMWKGTIEQYFDLYSVTSRHLKSVFPEIKIGGYASCGFYSLTGGFENSEANSSKRTDYFTECFQKFLNALQVSGAPLDFFSWHSYASSDTNCIYADYVRNELDKHGFSATESILDEWNPGTSRRGTEADACYISEMILKLHAKPLDMLVYYDGQIHGSYCGLFDPVKMSVFPAYYSIHSFGELLALGDEVKSVSDGEIPFLASTDGKIGKILTVNVGSEPIPVDLELPKNWRITAYRELDGTNGLILKNETDLSKIAINPMKIAIIECELLK